MLVALAWEPYCREDAPYWVRPAFLLAIPFAVIPIRDFLLEGNRYIFRIFTNGRDIEHASLDTALKLFLAAWIAVLLSNERPRAARKPAPTAGAEPDTTAPSST